MTEELEQKAKKWVKENACDWCVNADECKQGCIDCHGISGYIAGATVATKELQEELKLEKIENKDLIERVNELEEQIELQQKELEMQRHNVDVRCDQAIKSIKQLTKAKELLKRCYEYYIYLEPLRSEIKQFFKE